MRDDFTKHPALTRGRWLVLFGLAWVICWPPWAQAAKPPGVAATPTFEVSDSLDVGLDVEPDATARAMLADLVWEPGTFRVTREDPPRGSGVHAILSFASPRPRGLANQDRVTLQWYAARDESGAVVEAPAVLLVHSMHPDLLLARMIARGLSAKGVHAFVIEMPGYGRRVDQPRRALGVTALLHGRQGVADIRRGRDVIAALRQVEEGRVSIEGTSMGGFAAATAAALDGAFDRVFLVLTGGDAFDAISQGHKDAAVLRASMARAGYADEKLRALLAPIEPLPLAHRLDPARTLLFSARHDTVIRPRNADRLAESIGLPADRHVRFDGNHYSALLLLPGVVERMAAALGVEPREAARAPAGGVNR